MVVGMDQTPIQLNDLIADVVAAERAGGPLDRLDRACATGDILEGIADHLVGHFVDRARGAGVSWTQIGQHIGVSKQAARKRFQLDGASGKGSVKQMVFSQYTALGRQAIVTGQDIARQQQHTEVDTEHLLLGLLRHRNNRAVQVLEATGIAVDTAENAVRTRLAAPSADLPQKLPFTDTASMAIKLTVRVAFQHGHSYANAEHLLLGLYDVQTGLAVDVLTEHGLSRERIEREVVHLAPASRQRMKVCSWG